MKPIRVTDIRSDDGNEVHIEFSNGKIVVLTVEEILQAVEAVEATAREGKIGMN